VVAGDEELIAHVEPFDVAHIRRTVGLLVPAVAATAREDEVPHPINRRTPDLDPGRPREQVVDMAHVLRRSDDLDRGEAVEAVALLVAVERCAGPGDVRPASRDNEGRGFGLEPDRQQAAGNAELPRGLDQAPAGVDLLPQVRGLTLLKEYPQLIREPNAGTLLALIDEEPFWDLRPVHDVERIDHVGESEFDRLSAQGLAVEVPAVELAARIQEATPLGCSLLVVCAEMIRDAPGKRHREVLETDRIGAVSDL
jgi:hypothetical protein